MLLLSALYLPISVTIVVVFSLRYYQHDYFSSLFLCRSLSSTPLLDYFLLSSCVVHSPLLPSSSSSSSSSPPSASLLWLQHGDSRILGTACYIAPETLASLKQSLPFKPNYSRGETLTSLAQRYPVEAVYSRRTDIWQVLRRRAACIPRHTTPRHSNEFAVCLCV